MYILYQSDENYVPILGVSMTSLFENNQDIEYLKVFIAEFKVKDESKDKLFKLAERYNREIEFLDMEPVNVYLESTEIPKWRGSYSAYYKLFLNQYIPEYVDRILYIDCDTIVLAGLADFDKINLTEHAIAMVRTACNRKHLCTINAYQNRYYNAGVILYNIENWKRFSCEDTLLRGMNKQMLLFCPEQDLFVALMPQFIADMPIRLHVDSWLAYFGVTDYWRLFENLKERPYSFDEGQNAIKRHVVAHCMDEIFDRPWEKGNFNPFKEQWSLYRSMSPWPDFETERPHSLNRKILRFMCKVLPRPLYIFVYKIIINVNIYARVRAFENLKKSNHRLDNISKEQ